MNLKAKLQQIAKSKILNSQKSSVVSKKSCVAKIQKPHVAKKIAAKTITAKENIVSKEQKTFFPIVHVDFYKYNKPLEARFQSEAERELTQKFIKDSENKNKRKIINKRGTFGAVTPSLINLQRIK